MNSRRQFRRPIFLAAALALLAAFTASPARADRCDDSAKELSVACKGDKYSIELYAKGERNPKPEFIALVGSMAALVFSVTKDDTTTGATRCLKRMGVIRGDKISMRFRRLSLDCQRSKTEAWIAITRGKDE